MTTRFDRQALRIVEAAYNLNSATEVWMKQVLLAARPALDQGLGLLGFRYRVTAACRVQFAGQPQSAGPTPDGYGDTARAIAEALPPAYVRATWGHYLAHDTASDVFRRYYPASTPTDFEAFDAVPRAVGCPDNMVAKSLDADHQGLLLLAPMPAARPARADDEPRWQLVMAHLLAGLRLRRALAEGDGEAVLAGDGRVLHAEADARSSAARDALRRAAVAIDRARSRAGAKDPDSALRAWSALVSGRWSLVDRFDSDGRRFLIARRNDPAVPSPRALSERERQIAAYVGLGHSNKRIAYSLGLAPSTVSSHLQAAMRRLGARDPSALADLFFTPPPEEEEPS